MRNVFVALTVLALPLTVVACGSDEDSSSETVPATAAGEVPAGEPCAVTDEGEEMAAYIGLDEAAAEELATSQGYVLRVVGVDGECSAITMDLREDRVNVELAGGVVVAASMF